MSPRAAPAPPTVDEGMRLYRALLQSGPAATLDFLRAYLDPLAARLRARHRGASPDLCDGAALQAMHDFVRDPRRFDPGRGKSLLKYLDMAAEGDLRNLLRRERRHAHVPLDEKGVELGPPGGNILGGAGDPLQILCDREDEDGRRAALRSFAATLTEEEARVLDLILSGERGTPAFAAALGLGEEPPEAQEEQVKRVKDRIKARARRWGAGRE